MLLRKIIRGLSRRNKQPEVVAHPTSSIPEIPSISQVDTANAEFKRNEIVRWREAVTQGLHSKLCAPSVSLPLRLDTAEFYRLVHSKPYASATVHDKENAVRMFHGAMESMREKLMTKGYILQECVSGAYMLRRRTPEDLQPQGTACQK